MRTIVSRFYCSPGARGKAVTQRAVESLAALFCWLCALCTSRFPFLFVSWRSWKSAFRAARAPSVGIFGRNFFAIHFSREVFMSAVLERLGVIRLSPDPDELVGRMQILSTIKSVTVEQYAAMALWLAVDRLWEESGLDQLKAIDCYCCREKVGPVDFMATG